MRTLASSRRLALTMVGFALIAVAALWTMAGVAAADPAQPTIKELLEKRSKERRVAEPPPRERASLGAPEDELGRGVPRSSVRGFLAATKTRDYVRAAEYLELSNLPSGMTQSQGPELARQLRIVLDRVLWIDLDLLSTSPDGDQADGLPDARDRVGRIAGQARPYDILLQRVPRGGGTYAWKFSATTVADIPSLYAEFGYGSLETVFPPWVFDTRILGVEVWFLVALILAASLAFPVAMALTAVLIALRRRIHPPSAEEAATFLTGPLRLLIAVLLIHGLMDLAGLSLVAQTLVQASTLLFAALAWLVLRLLDLFTHRISARLEERGLAGSIVLLKPATRLVKLVVLVGAVLLWLDNVGYRVTTLLAGLSISGLAVALASQKSLENVFGAITLYSSQPVRIGDFCRFGDQIGTVEEIGLRATKIRTLDRTVVSVPNAEFVHLHLDNFSLRDRFWYHPQLNLRYETTPDQIRYLLIEVRKMLYAHPKVLSEPLWVRFHGFGEYSLDLEVFAYIGVTQYSESLEVAEDLNLRIMDIVAAAGTQFAFPAQIEYQMPGPQLDPDRARVAEAKVNEWRAQKALYLPNFPEQKIAEVRGSLDYPPVGAPGQSRSGA